MRPSASLIGGKSRNSADQLPCGPAGFMDVTFHDDISGEPASLNRFARTSQASAYQRGDRLLKLRRSSIFDTLASSRAPYRMLYAGTNCTRQTMPTWNRVPLTLDQPGARTVVLSSWTLVFNSLGVR